MSRPYKLWLLTSLYLAQGLPFGFFTQALPVLMREAGMSLKLISATSLLFIPWALKFLWAPYVDRVGSRKQWLMVLQWSAVLGSLALSQIEIQDSFTALFIALFLFNVLAAAQDVVTDGLGVRLLGPEERGLGNGIQVGAYRIGMILGGGLLLWILAKTSWDVMFFGMAGILLLTCIPVLFLKEPAREASPSATQKSTLLGWQRRLRVPGFWAFIGLIALYKFGDSMGASLGGPFLKDMGLSKEEIAVLKGTVASGVTLFGAAAGGWLAFRHGRRFTLLGCGLLQSASLVLYALAAAHIGGLGMIWGAVIAEHLFGGMATVALFTLMMDASDPDHASTDYTLLACAIVITQGLANFSGAVLADAVGYAPVFWLATLLSGIGCLWLVAQLDRGRGPQRLHSVWNLKNAAPDPASQRP